MGGGKHRCQLSREAGSELSCEAGSELSRVAVELGQCHGTRVVSCDYSSLES